MSLGRNIGVGFRRCKLQSDEVTCLLIRSQYLRAKKSGNDPKLHPKNDDRSLQQDERERAPRQRSAKR
eukprot:447158-Hanusia_phi.AAC.7